MDSLSGLHLVGRRVRKLFPGYGLFEGSITSFNPIKALYKVEYEDGDREDMELHEVQQFLLQDTPFRNASPLASDDDDDDYEPNAGCSPSSSPTHKHGSAASSPSSDVFHQTPMSNSFSLPNLEISNMPLSQDLYTQILQSNCSSKRKLDDVCNAVETSFICTKVKKARRKVKEINDNVPSYVAVTWMNQCVKDLEEDEVSISEHVESHAHDVNEKTECLENVMMYANSHMKNSQNLSHGYEDAESFIASNEESIGTDIPSAYSSVSVEYAIQDSNHDATTLPFLEPLPPSSNDFLVPQDLVLDFLEIYSFLRSFSRALFLSPFTLESFQQCLCSHTPTGLMDSVHLCLLQALRRNLERLAKAGLAIARGCLRHLDWTLLDIITWPSHLMAYLAMYGFEGTQDFKFALSRAEYYKLAVKNKVTILNFLCHHVMDTDEIRTEVATRELLFADNLEEDLNDMPQKEFQQPESTMGGAFKVEVLEKQEVKEKNNDECMLCGMNGDLLCCDGCPAAYHARCVGISRSTLPQGDWFCPECVIDGLGKKQLDPIGLRGGDLLGVDPYGHTFIAAWGYLLVIKSCTGSKLNYYNFKDLPIVVYWLEKMSPFCDPVKSKILHYWCLVQRTLPESCVLGISPQEIILKSTQTCEHSHPRGEMVEGFAGAVAKESTVTERCVLALPVPNLESMPGANKFDLKTEGLTSRCGFTENTRIETISSHHPVRDYVRCHNEIRADSNSLDNSIGSDGGQQCFLYTNYYSQGDAAATAAASLATQNAKRKARMNPFNEQLQAFCKSSVQFYWPNVHKQLMEATDEKCGWCFCCSYPSIKKGCILNQAAGILAAGAGRVSGGICPTNFGLGHLPAVAGYLLHIEDNVKAVLLGPWQDAGFRKWWRKEIKHAEHVNDLKFLLLQLESCLRPVLLSGKWFNDPEDAPSLSYRSFLEDTDPPNRAYKKLKWHTSVQTTRLHAVEALLLQYWKHGKNAKKIFQWYLLPSHIARQAGRQGGLKKIQGLVYSEELDWARRSKRCAWQARVEAACTVSQLALQVRCLDAYIRWDDLHSLRSVDTIRTDTGLKPATVYAKKWKGNAPLYLVDLEIIKHSKKTLKLVPSKDANKVWVTDTQMPLSLLRNFEERLWLRRQNKHCNDTVTGSWLKTYGRGLKRGFFEHCRLRSSSCSSFTGEASIN